VSASLVARGLERQLRARGELIAAGRAALGWKAAFGAPTFLERFGLSGPVIGFMTDASLLETGCKVDVSAWSRAVAEPEVAAYLSDDIQAHSDESAVRSAISALGPAIELADIDLPLDDLEEIVAGNIFHRHVILGDRDRARERGRLDGLEARIRLGGDEVARTDRLEELTGRLVEVIAHLAKLLGEHGERLRAGDVVICGSVVPPITLTPGLSVEFDLHPLRPISVHAT
jgi:2-keto-4-pentenoate hydratase